MQDYFLEKVKDNPEITRESFFSSLLAMVDLHHAKNMHNKALVIPPIKNPAIRLSMAWDYPVLSLLLAKKRLLPLGIPPSQAD